MSALKYAIVLGLLVLTSCVTTTSQKQYLDEDLASIQHKFISEQSSLTDLQKEELWKTYEGKLVKGEAYVHSVDETLFGGCVILADFQPRGEYDFTSDLAIFFKDSEKDKLLKLSKNEHFAFEGKLVRYHDLLGNLDIEDAILTTDTQVQEKSNKKTEDTVVKTCSKEFDERAKSATSLIQQITISTNNVTDAIKHNNLMDIASYSTNYHKMWSEYRPKLVEFYTWLKQNPECIPQTGQNYTHSLQLLIDQIDQNYLLFNRTMHQAINQKIE